jgi:ribonuclease VapC
MEHASSIAISAASFLEVSIVVDGLGKAVAELAFETTMTNYNIETVPVTESQVRTARIAYRRYGRGNHNDSNAKLNFGDCFAYALAREKNEPLLFVGDDFTHTDITPALS